MEELYINDILIELPLKSVSRTLQINDIGDVQDRQANYSNKIKIPRTPNNIATFEMLGIVGNKTRIPYSEVNVKYVVDGIELISSGKGIIKNTNNVFNLVIYDGNIDLLDTLGDKRLSTLDFSAHNHDLTLTSYFDSFSNTSGYIYGLGRFYDNSPINGFNIDLQNSSFYIHTLIDMIFDEENITISGDIFTDADYKSRVTSMNNGYLRNSTDSLTLKYSQDTSLLPIFNESFAQPTTKKYLIDTYNTTNHSIFNISLIGTLSIITGTNPRVITTVDDLEISNRSVSSGAINEVYNIEAVSGVSIKIFIEVTSEFLVSDTIHFDTDYITTIYENDISIPINFNELIGDVKRIDFVKDVMQRFGLIFRRKRISNEYEFIRIGELLADKVNAENWTDKYSSFVNESYNSGYAQTNFAKHKYDDNDSGTDQTFADGDLLIDDINLNQTKTILNSIFKASELIDNFNILKQWELKDDLVQPKDDGLRIFKINSVLDSFNYKFNDSIDSLSNFTGTVPYLSFSSLAYQNELDKYYLEFQSLLNSYKKITVECNLSLIDIYELDFFKLKYFKQLSKLFYLNKVSNYKKGRKTKCEFIEIGEDVVPANLMSADLLSGSSLDADLTQLLFGSMIATLSGGSTLSALLRLSSVTAFDISNQTIELNVCPASLVNTYYHNGGNPQPIIGDLIYTDGGGTILLNGNDLFFKLTGIDYIQVNTVGEVINKTSC